MTSIKVKFRASGDARKPGRIYYQIVHERKVRQVVADYAIFARDWDLRRGLYIGDDVAVRDGIRRDIGRITRIVRGIESKGLVYTADDIVQGFREYCCKISLYNYMCALISDKKLCGKLRTAETYASALKSFQKFVANACRQGLLPGDKDVMLDCITSALMQAYEAWLRGKGLMSNTVGFYTRILRAVYNRAVDEGVIDDARPFRKVYTGVDKTIKRALPAAVISMIAGLDLAATPGVDFARDMFMMSFYLRGMSYVDMANLHKSDLRNGFITYRRRKTGQMLTIAWLPQMQAILDKYPENQTDYLLPIITKSTVNIRRLCQNKAYTINRNLKHLAATLDIAAPLTLYVARHSWASIARAKGIPLSVISEGLGHDSETTTQIYLASLDTSAVDCANALIINSLK